MASNVESLIRGAVKKGIGAVADFNRKCLPTPADAHPYLTGIHTPMDEELTLEALREPLPSDWSEQRRHLTIAIIDNESR